MYWVECIKIHVGWMLERFCRMLRSPTNLKRVGSSYRGASGLSGARAPRCMGKMQGAAHAWFFGSSHEPSDISQDAQLDKEIDVLSRMDQQGTVPSLRKYRSLLRTCSQRKAITQANRVHAHITKHGLESNKFVGECLVSTLVKCGGLESALRVFSLLAHRTVLSWTAVISGYTMHGRHYDALSAYQRMQEEGVRPNTYTFVTVLKACGNSTNLETGRQIHTEVVASRCASDMFVGASLIDMYSKCGRIDDAENVFNGLSLQNVLPWNALLAAYLKRSEIEKALQLYERMREQGLTPDARTYVYVLQACGILGEKEGHILLGEPIKATSLKMQGNAVSPDVWTSVSLIQACGMLADSTAGMMLEASRCLQIGKVIHADTWKKGLNKDVFIATALVDMYGKCGSIGDASCVFNQICDCDIVAWTALIAAHSQQGYGEASLELYERMWLEGFSPNERTLVSVLQACSTIAEKGDGEHDQANKFAALQRGRVIHSFAVSKCCTANVFLGSSLISLYSKCGSVADAQNVFDSLPLCGVVTWTAMLAVYVDWGEAEKVLQLYTQMLVGGVSPDVWTYVTMVQACCLWADVEDDVVVDGRATKLEALGKGKAVHAEAEQKGHGSEFVVACSLISMYGRCGSRLDAEIVFNGLANPGVAAWNAMIGMYADGGDGCMALGLYGEMKEVGVTPDEITYLSLLQACCRMGSLTACRQVHHSCNTCLSPLLNKRIIHAYARCGSMGEARKVFDTLSNPDVVAWTTLMAGYARQGDYLASIHCYEEMQQTSTKPDGVTLLSLLAACSHVGLVDQGVEYFDTMTREYGVTPKIEHFVSLVDLLGRAGSFTTIELLLLCMPMEPDLALWLCLLGACRKHGELRLGKRAFDHAVQIQPMSAAAYVLMSSMYADAGLPDLTWEVKHLQQKEGAWKMPGRSWIEKDEEEHGFTAGYDNVQGQGQVCEFLIRMTVALRGVGQQCEPQRRSGIYGRYLP